MESVGITVQSGSEPVVGDMDLCLSWLSNCLRSHSLQLNAFYLCLELLEYLFNWLHDLYHM